MSCLGCAQLFDQDTHLPKILIECGHTVCITCLSESFVDGSLKCLECGQGYQLDSLDLLPTNKALLRLQVHTPINMLTESNSTISDCKIPRSPNSNCATNNQNIVHMRQKSILLQGCSSPPENLTSRSSIYCPEENENNLNEICQIHFKPIVGFCETDKHLICVECVFETHKNHDIYTIDKAMHRHTEKCDTLEEKIESLNTGIVNRKNEFSLKESEIKNGYHKHSMKIKKVFAEFKQVLNKKQKEFEKGLEESYFGILRKLNDHNFELETVEKKAQLINEEVDFMRNMTIKER